MNSRRNITSYIHTYTDTVNTHKYITYLTDLEVDTAVYIHT